MTIASYRSGGGAWEHADQSTVLRPGDTVLAIGPTERVDAFAQLR